jgi:hypothetical protein
MHAPFTSLYYCLWMDGNAANLGIEHPAAAAAAAAASARCRINFCRYDSCGPREPFERKCGVGAGPHRVAMAVAVAKDAAPVRSAGGNDGGGGGGGGS